MIAVITITVQNGCVALLFSISFLPKSVAQLYCSWREGPLFRSFLKFSFNWRIISLRYFDGFCLHQLELATGIRVSPPTQSPLPSPSFQVIKAQDFPGGSNSTASAYNTGDLGSIPGLGRSPGEGNGNPLQYSCLEKSHGQRSLVDYSPWGHKESDTTERLHFTSLDILP